MEQFSASSQKTDPPPNLNPAKTAELYPKLRFWSQTRYYEWSNSPEARSNPRYKFAFVEDENGNPVSDVTLRSIRKTIRGCWAELVTKNIAPKSWGKANTSAKELVFSLTYKSFPFLQLAENNWKTDLLCSMDYPGWVRNNLDDQGNWLSSSRRVKLEEGAGDPFKVNEAGASTGRKRKAQTSKSETPPDKKLKGRSFEIYS